MIPYEMHKIIYLVGDRLAIFTWGFMVAVAWLFVGYLMYKQAKNTRDINVNYAMQFLLAAFIGVYAGARLLHNFGPWDHGTLYERFIDMFSPTGGWVGYGAIIGVIVLPFIYSRIRKINYFRYIDAVVVSGAMGIFIVKLGCFIAGCCYGSPTNVAWAVIREGMAIHPTQLYDSLVNLAIFVILLGLMKKRENENKFHGYLLLSFLLLYSVGRFFTEFFRGDYGPDNYFFGLTASQLIAIGMFAAAAVVFILKSGREPAEKSRKKTKPVFSIRPKTYALVLSGGITANIGAYIITPAFYLGIALLAVGLAAAFAGISTIFSAKGNRKGGKR